jgi:hypothetical protein
MLCDICLGVIQHRRGMRTASIKSNVKTKWHPVNPGDNLKNLIRFRSSHHRTFSTLSESMSRGCRICRSLWKDLSESERDTIRNFDATAENRDLTEMRIDDTTDRGYNIIIKLVGLFTSVYGLHPG